MWTQFSAPASCRTLALPDEGGGGENPPTTYTQRRRHRVGNRNPIFRRIIRFTAFYSAQQLLEKILKVLFYGQTLHSPTSLQPERAQRE